MPTPAYISIQGKTQGNITQGAFTADSVGNVYQEGHEDQILVQEVEHLIATPTDPQSGQPSGQRVHKPFTGHPREDIFDSRDYMSAQLNIALGAGPTSKGFRHFGAALHVLEDYFAHSNFVELSLRKLHPNVLAWTAPRSSAQSRHALPVVTGMFGSLDCGFR